MPRPVGGRPKGKKKGDKSKLIAVIVFGAVPAFLAITLGLSGPKAPSNAKSTLEMGMQLDKEGKTVEAAATVHAVVDANPDWSQGHYSLAIYLRSLGNYTGSIHHNLEALRTDPSMVQAMVNCGISYERVNKVAEARDMYVKAVKMYPNFWEGHNSLAILSQVEGDVDAARKHWTKCRKIRFDPSVPIKMAMTLPPVFESREQMDQLWARYKEEVDAIAMDSTIKLERDAYFSVGMSTFYLGYFGYNARAHMHSLSNMFQRVDPELNYVAAHLRPYFLPGTSIRDLKGRRLPAEAVPLSPGGKYRVGIISKHFRGHSIGKLTRGLVKYLPREQLEVHLLVPGQRMDSMTNELKNSADYVAEFPDNLKVARSKIETLKLHVLLYMDIGMESFTYFLAFSRLAPIQCMTHGHPVTSGIPSMDYFVSFQDYEPESNQRFYTEQLVRIEGMSDRYEQPPVPSLLEPKQAFGFSDDDHVYMSPQSLFKFHPDFDEMVMSVLRQDPLAKLAVIEERHGGWAKIVLSRMANTTGATQEELSRIVFLPRAQWTTFMNYLGVADVVLDTYPFGGDTSSREALFMGTPVVTLPSTQLAGRYTQAFLRVVGVPELIANDVNDYVAKALRVAKDKAYRAELVLKIKQNKRALFDDQDTVLAWEDFFVSRSVEIIE